MTYEFPFNTLDFLTKLKENNNRKWFHNHKAEYDKNFLIPAQIAVIRLGDYLQKYVPDINAIPEINKSIFRLQRDVRFSKDKKPYKTNLGIYLWEGDWRRLESSGFYFHIEPGLFLLAVGFYMFPSNILKKFREILLYQTKESELYRIIKTLKRKGYTIEESKYKKLPKGFTPEHHFAELSKFSGLYAMFETKDFNQFYKLDIIKFASEVFKDMVPLHKWIVNNLYH